MKKDPEILKRNRYLSEYVLHILERSTLIIGWRGAKGNGAVISFLDGVNIDRVRINLDDLENKNYSKIQKYLDKP